MNKHRRRAAYPTQPRIRPALEQLESRFAPAVVTWDGGGDGMLWDDPLNWDTNTLPGSNDDAVISASSITVFHPTGNVTLNSLHSDADLEWTGNLTLADASALTGAFHFNGTLNLQTGVTLDISGGGSASGTIQLAANSEFLLSGGGAFDAWNALRVLGQGQIIIGNGQTVNLNGNITTDRIVLGPGGVLDAMGSLTVTNQFTWTGGTIRGAGTINIDNGASLLLSGAQTKTVQNSTLEIAATGSANLTGGQLILSDATINNHGCFALGGNNVGMANIGNSTIANWGTFQKDLSQNTDVSEVAGRFVNMGGEVSGITGILYFTGQYEQYVPGSVLSIASEVRAINMEISAGTVEGNGWLWIGDGAVTGLLNLGDATLNGQGIVNVEPTSFVHILSTVNLAQFRLENYGTVRWISGDVHLSEGASIWNEPGAEFRIECDALMDDATEDSTFHNFGTLRKVQGTGSAEIGVDLEYQSLLNQPPAFLGVDVGSLRYTANGRFAAPVEVAANSFFSFRGLGKNTLLQQGTSFTGAGNVVVTRTATITVDEGAIVTFWTELDIGWADLGQGIIRGAGELDARGLVRWFDGFLVDLNLFRNRSVMRIENNFQVTMNSSVLRNEGTIHWISGNILMDDEANATRIAQIDNHSIFNATDNNIMPVDPMNSKGEFHNEAGGIVATIVGPGSTQIEIPFINYGSIILVAGDLTFTSAFEQNQGDISLGSRTMTVPSLTIAGGWLNLGNNGAGNLVVPGGLIIGVNGNLAGVGMITGNVVNWGRIEIGHFGTPRGSITIFGDFTQLASGRLEFRLPDQIGGFNDFLQATGTATLNGTLEIKQSGGINPILGDEFDFLFYGTLVGQFSSYIRPPLGQGLDWQTIYDANWLTLKVVQA